MSEIRPLGHVDSESQSGEEVTAAFTDLEARLANSRHTEQRIVDLLRERTGKLSDVLEAERELDRVRGEIEQMEAQRKGLLKRVDYATLTLNVNEEYKAQLHADGSPSTQFRNAAVDGFRSAAGSLVGDRPVPAFGRAGAAAVGRHPVLSRAFRLATLASPAQGIAPPGPKTATRVAANFVCRR